MSIVSGAPLLHPTSYYVDCYESSEDEQSLSPKRKQKGKSCDVTESSGDENGSPMRFRFTGAQSKSTMDSKGRRGARSRRSAGGGNIGERLFNQRKPTARELERQQRSNVSDNSDEDSDEGDERPEWDERTRIVYDDEGVVSPGRDDWVKHKQSKSPPKKRRGKGEPEIGVVAGERLYKQAQHQQERIKKAASESKALQAKNEVSECTFKPGIGEATSLLVGSPEPLYKRYPLYVARQGARQLKETADQRAREGAECVFRPTVNPVSTELAAGSRGDPRSIGDKLHGEQLDVRIRQAAREATLGVSLQKHDIVGGGIISAKKARHIANRLNEWATAKKARAQRVAKQRHLSETTGPGHQPGKRVDVQQLLTRLVPFYANKEDPTAGDDSAFPYARELGYADLEDGAKAIRKQVAKHALRTYGHLFDMHYNEESEQHKVRGSRISYRVLKAFLIEEDPRSVSLLSAVHRDCGNWIDKESFCIALMEYEEDFGPQRWSHLPRHPPNGITREARKVEYSQHYDAYASGCKQSSQPQLDRARNEVSRLLQRTSSASRARSPPGNRSAMSNSVKKVKTNDRIDDSGRSHRHHRRHNDCQRSASTGRVAAALTTGEPLIASDYSDLLDSLHVRRKPHPLTVSAMREEEARREARNKLLEPLHESSILHHRSTNNASGKGADEKAALPRAPVTETTFPTHDDGRSTPPAMPVSPTGKPPMSPPKATSDSRT